MAHPFEEYVFNQFAQAIRRWHAKDEVHVHGFYILDEEDDGRRSVVRLMRNTRAHAQLHTKRFNQTLPVPEACLSYGKVLDCKQDGQTDDWNEALWSLAFWDSAVYAVVGCEYPAFKGDYVDPEGLALRKDWVVSLGLWYEDGELDPDEAISRSVDIYWEFLKLCIRVARRLKPLLRERFGQPLPIIFFDREIYTHESFTCTYFANEAEELDGFIDFICDYTGDEGWRTFFTRKRDESLDEFHDVLWYALVITQTDPED